MQYHIRLPRMILWLLVMFALLSSCATPTQVLVLEKPTVRVTQTKIAVQRATVTLAPTLPLPPSYSEAPALAALVENGKLPPVIERLPANPKVIQPAESIGKYGGTWRRTMKPSGDSAQFIRTVRYESLVTWTPDGNGIQPDIAESYEVSPDASTFTFHLREGMKWSDGEPFTSRDIQFWWEDIILNDDLYPSKPLWL